LLGGAGNAPKGHDNSCQLGSLVFDALPTKFRLQGVESDGVLGFPRGPGIKAMGKAEYPAIPMPIKPIPNRPIPKPKFGPLKPITMANQGMGEPTPDACPNPCSFVHVAFPWTPSALSLQ